MAVVLVERRIQEVTLILLGLRVALGADHPTHSLDIIGTHGNPEQVIGCFN